jgi:hypothetical protein
MIARGVIMTRHIMPLIKLRMEVSQLMEVKTIRPKQEACDELYRELQIRKRCFKRWVGEGRLSMTDAQDRLDRLASALELLEATTPGAVKQKIDS